MTKVGRGSRRGALLCEAGPWLAMGGPWQRWRQQLQRRCGGLVGRRATQQLACCCSGVCAASRP